MLPFHYTNSQLFCEDIPADYLAAKFGTPLYVYSATQLRANIAAFTETIAALGADCHVSYALKANANPAILKIICDAGLGADVVSGGELSAALKAGFAPERITYAGVGKRDEEIQLGLHHGIGAFCVESEEELDVINALAEAIEKRARIAIRVNPDVDAGTHPYISTGTYHNKFGIAIRDARSTFRRAATMRGIEIVGVHAHIGSQISTSDPFSNAAHAVANLVNELKADGIALKTINMGGGFGVEYRNVIRHPLIPNGVDSSAYAPLTTMLKPMIDTLRSTGAKLIIEPGRAIASSAGALLARTLYTKRTDEKHFTIIDAAMNDLMRPCLYDAYHQIVPGNLVDRPIISTDVVGPVCESSDFLARDREMRTPLRGDLLAVLSTGAYGYTLASNYTMRGRAAEVMVEGGIVRLIRDRETL